MWEAWSFTLLYWLCPLHLRFEKGSTIFVKYLKKGTRGLEALLTAVFWASSTALEGLGSRAAPCSHEGKHLLCWAKEWSAQRAKLEFFSFAITFYLKKLTTGCNGMITLLMTAEIDLENGIEKLWVLFKLEKNNTYLKVLTT